MNSININNIKTKKGVKIIDIQSPYYYNINHISGAINIPYDELMNNYRKYLNKNERKSTFSNGLTAKTTIIK